MDTMDGGNHTFRPGEKARHPFSGQEVMVVKVSSKSGNYLVRTKDLREVWVDKWELEKLDAPKGKMKAARI